MIDIRDQMIKIHLIQRASVRRDYVSKADDTVPSHKTKTKFCMHSSVERLKE